MTWYYKTTKWQKLHTLTEAWGLVEAIVKDLMQCHYYPQLSACIYRLHLPDTLLIESVMAWPWSVDGGISALNT